MLLALTQAEEQRRRAFTHASCYYAHHNCYYTSCCCRPTQAEEQRRQAFERSAPHIAKVSKHCTVRTRE